jgi:hypothetical protein
MGEARRRRETDTARGKMLDRAYKAAILAIDDVIVSAWWSV